MDVPNATKRYACDRCRSKRVRCPRAANSTSPCSRCNNAGTPCVTGSAGSPGRPRKVRNVENVTREVPIIAPPEALSLVDWSSPARIASGSASNLHLEDTNPPLAVPESIEWFKDDSNFWTTLNLHFAEDTPTSGPHSTQHNDPTTPQRQALFGAPSNANMLCTNLGSSDKVSVCPSSHPYDSLASTRPAPQLKGESRLRQVREKMEQCIEIIGTFFSDPHYKMQDCVQKRATVMEPTNPVAVFLECIDEFTDAVQNLKGTAAQEASNYDDPQPAMKDTSSRGIEPDLLHSETALLVLSCYLQLLRLCESLFHGVCDAFSQMAPHNFKSVKVKAVFRIGGVSSLQDISAKAYATGILDVIQCQMQNLERGLGLPGAYCLFGDVVEGDPQASASGLFARKDRARLLQVAMEQEDVKTYRGDKSCLQSIQENIQKTAAFFRD